MFLRVSSWITLLWLGSLLVTACGGRGQAPTDPAPASAPPATSVIGGSASTPNPQPATQAVPSTPPIGVSTPLFSTVAPPTNNPGAPPTFSFATPIVFPTPENWRPPVAGVPLSVNARDHFWFARPIASDSVNYPLLSYRYGSDYFGQMTIHAGIDVDAPLGTPIRAAGPGTVVWAGWGLFFFEFGREDDPYGIAVVVKHDFGYNGETLYTLYAHMEAENNLFVGQRVETGDVLGWVGVTGNTTGPHVHFEVRVGKNDYYATRNPELWIAPYAGWGVLAGQVLDKNGRYINSTPIDIFNAQTGRLVYTVYTYGFRVASPDDQWRENFAISDLPAGKYRLKAAIGYRPTITQTIAGATPETTEEEIEIIEGVVELAEGQTTFVILQSGVGLLTNVPPAETLTPPYPTNTSTPTPTPTDTPTITPTRTPRPTNTITPTRTPRPTITPTPTRTITRTRTPLVSSTPTRTPFPTPTPTEP